MIRMDQEKVRKRESYKLFKGLSILIGTTSKKDVLEWLWKELDRRSAFGSEKNANFAKESLQLVIEDCNL